jgi:predicted N-acyltransferase
LAIDRTLLKPAYTFAIYDTVAALPSQWNALASENIFLSRAYLEVLEKSAPENMLCHFIGIFDGDKLAAIAVSQFLDLNKLDSFGNRDQCLKTMVRDFTFRNFASHVLFIGNNMLTGQHALVFAKAIDTTRALQTLRLAAAKLRKKIGAQGKKIHLTTYKDFDASEAAAFEIPEFANSYRFSTQPNMVLDIREDWKTEEDYVNAFQKKYRDQYKRARKKSEGIEKRKLSLEEIIAYEDIIYALYLHVAKHAPFNSFYLARNHFRILKENLKEAFRFYGYFLDGKFVGFSTLIKNGCAMETYFLGYDDSVQREKMLYLNMLYDMIAYSIKKGFKEIIFARTALEIKSSVGAKPIEMFGFIEHQNALLNKITGRIFNYVEPKTIWQQRHPFK